MLWIWALFAASCLATVVQTEFVTNFYKRGPTRSNGMPLSVQGVAVVGESVGGTS